VGMLRKSGYAAALAAGIISVALACGCGKKDFNKEVVATVNDDKITVLELREYLGAPFGIFTFTTMPAEQKTKAVEQMVAGLLLVQEGRAMGLDNTPEYKESVQKGQVAVRINALIQKEASEKLKFDEKEVQAEASKIKGENAGLPETEAAGRAAMTLVDRQIRKIRKDLVMTARKETNAAIDNAALERISKGESVPDNAVLASVGSEKILYADVKKVIREMKSLPIRQGGENIEAAIGLITNILENDLTLRAMTEYSKKRGVDGSEWHRTSQRNLERTVISNMTFERFIANTAAEVTDEEVAADYDRRVQMMAGDKAKAPALGTVKEQLREVLKNQKRRGAFEQHIGELRKKGKVTVKDDVLPKV
jgi:hypothetical protein